MPVYFLVAFLQVRKRGVIPKIRHSRRSMDVIIADKTQIEPGKDQIIRDRMMNKR